MSDHNHRFLFEQFDIRGQLLQLDASYRQVLANNPESAPVQRLLGECLAAAGLLSSTLKFEGILGLQTQGDGPVAMMMAECTHQSDLRGIVRAEGPVDTGEALLGKGVLAITIDPEDGERYQGIVSLDGDDLASAVEGYFAQSEQLPTRLWLAADGERAAGLLLQSLPRQVAGADANAQAWERISALADTLRDDELLELTPQTLLHRLFHQEQVRLFDPQALRFRCSCTPERNARALASLGQEDVSRLLAEQGEITVDCQFCNQRYRYGLAEITELFAGGRRH